VPKHLTYTFQSVTKQAAVKQRPGGNDLPVNGKANAD